MLVECCHFIPSNNIGEVFIYKKIAFMSHIYIRILTAYVAQLAKASDTQAVGHRFDSRPDH